MRKLLALATSAALLTAGFGAASSASASTGGEVAEPKASTWVITANKFGPHRLGESVKAASHISHIGYTPALRKALGKGTKAHCPQPVRLPLTTKGVNKRNFWALVSLPCDTGRRSLAAYEAKYKPYAKAEVNSFVASANEWDGTFAPHYAYGSYLPHASVGIGDPYAVAAATYPAGRLDQGYTDNLGNTFGTFVVVGKQGSRATELRMRIEADSITTISTSRFPAGY